MKIRAKKILLIFFITVLLLSALYQVLVIQAGNVFVSNLRRLTGQTVSIKTLTCLPPCNFHLKNLEIGERKDQRYFSAERISISVSLLASLLQRQPVFTEILVFKPGLYFEREEPAKYPARKPGAHNAVFAPSRLDISNGTVEFIDRMTPAGKIGITLSRVIVRAVIKNNKPSAGIVTFKADADLLLGPQSPSGRISLHGRTDPESGVAKARLEIKNVDGLYLYPYYAQWLDVEKAHFQKALLDLSADITGTGKKFTASCRLELTENQFMPLAQGREPDRPQKLAMLVIDILKALDNRRAFVDFSIRFDADKPQLDWTPLADALQEKIKKGVAIRPAEIRDVLKLPESLIKGTVGKLGGMTKSIMGQTMELEQQLQQSIQDTFIKVTPKQGN